MLKSRRLAYDGRGNFVVATAADAPAAWAALGGASGGGLFAERWVPFVRELAVVVARDRAGATAAYPVVHTVQRDSICHVVLAPAVGVAPGVVAAAAAVAAAAVGALGGAGVFGVELFELADGRVLLNEVAPRVHNSGHFSTEACTVSQFEQHVRAVCGLPLGDASLRVPAAAMINVLGAGDGAAAEAPTWRLCAAALAAPGASVHWYGKEGAMKRGRKVGHVTVTGSNAAQVLARVRALLVAGAGGGGSGAGGAGGDAGAADAALAGVAAAPLVGVIMGSDSDLPAMAPCAAVLRDFGVPFEVTIVSAHRTPDRLVAYARGARARGLRVIVAAAGGAAHLPGMVAAMTPLPVVGVPIALKYLDGVDALHSMVQMPRGVPVATVAIGNAANGALLALRILGAADGTLLDKLEAFAAQSRDEVLGKAARLERDGVDAYLAAAAGGGH
jgi:phosphoribosylaminoimidazole carboxylase